MPKDQKGTGTLQCVLKHKLNILLKYLHDQFVTFRPYTDAAKGKNKTKHVFLLFVTFY